MYIFPALAMRGRAINHRLLFNNTLELSKSITSAWCRIGESAFHVTHAVYQRDHQQQNLIALRTQRIAVKLVYCGCRRAPFEMRSVQSIMGGVNADLIGHMNSYLNQIIWNTKTEMCHYTLHLKIASIVYETTACNNKQQIWSLLARMTFSADRYHITVSEMPPQHTHISRMLIKSRFYDICYHSI